MQIKLIAFKEWLQTERNTIKQIQGKIQGRNGREEKKMKLLKGTQKQCNKDKKKNESEVRTTDEIRPNHGNKK